MKFGVQVEVTRPLKLEIFPFTKSIFSTIFYGSWQMTTDSETVEQYLNFVRTRFLNSILAKPHAFTLLRKHQQESAQKQ